MINRRVNYYGKLGTIIAKKEVNGLTLQNMFVVKFDDGTTKIIHGNYLKLQK